MPTGPFPDFGACEKKLTSKYKNNTKAKKICGMLEKQSQGRGRTLRANYFGSEKDLETFLDSKKTLEFDKNGDVWMKHFLFDESMTANYWNLNPRYVPRNLPTVIGKPVVMYQNTGLEPPEYDDLGLIIRAVGENDHPPMNDNDINHLLAMQEPYRVGTSRQTVQHPNDGSYWALSQIHDSTLRQKLTEEPDIPFFTSPALRVLEDQPAGEPVKDFVYLHTALVDRPGFGIKRANVTATCTGNEKTCLLHLKRASASLAAEHGIDLTKGCPFCTRKAIEKIASNIRADGLEDLAKSQVMFNNNDNNLTKRASVNSSYQNSSATIQTDKKVSENPVINATQNAVPENQHQHSNASPPTAISNNTQANSQESQALSTDEKIAELTRQLKTFENKSRQDANTIQQLQGSLQAAQNITNGWQQSYQELKSRLDQRDSSDKRKEVKALVDRAEIYKLKSREEKDQMIEELTNTNLTLPQLKKWLAPGEERLIELQNQQNKQQQQEQQLQQQQLQPQTVTYIPGQESQAQSVNNDASYLSSSPQQYSEPQAPVITASARGSAGTQYGGGTNNRNITASAGLGNDNPSGADLVRSFRSSFLNRQGDSE